VELKSKKIAEKEKFIDENIKKIERGKNVEPTVR